MTIQQLLTEYQEISQMLDKKWPMEDKQKRAFARMTKLVEELGEFADQILHQADLQREEKGAETKKHLEQEFADTAASLFLLGLELNIDIPLALQEHIERTKQRHQDSSI